MAVVVAKPGVTATLGDKMKPVERDDADKSIRGKPLGHAGRRLQAMASSPTETSEMRAMGSESNSSSR